MIYQPAWNSWMGDLVDPKERGSFFGKRNNMGVIIQFACFLTAGQILQMSASGLNNKVAGFFIIFSIALVARAISAVLMSMKWEPEYSPEEEHITTLSEISDNEEYSNYKKFITFVPLMVFFGSVSAPFAVPYILKDLNYSYATYTFIVGGAFLMRILTMPVWGRIADIFGPRKVIATTVFFTVVTQLLWLVSGKVPYLIAIMCVSGFVFAGFEISLNAYLFDSTNSKNRVMGFTYFNVVNGLSGVAGALFGGFLVKHNSLFWSPYLIVFPVAALGRLIVALLFIPRFQEIRKTREASGLRIFSHVFMGMPTTDLILRTFSVISRKR
jgi:MFS family permease